MIQGCSDGLDADQWCDLYNKTVRFLNRHPGKIHYRQGRKSPDNPSLRERLGNYRIISFGDAGFASSEGDRIVESNVVIFGRNLFRDGAIRFHGYLIDPRCAKLQRVRRSSLLAECHAAVTAGDYALRYQVLLIEFFAHSYQIRRLRPPTHYPMINPFSDSPSDAPLKADKVFWDEFEFQ